MSTTINGNAANVTTPLTATIASAVAGSGITTCTTSAPHLFGNSDQIIVANATGMTGLNAQWTITVTGATTFTVPSALSGTYGASSATATNFSLTPQFQWPTSADSTDAQLSGLISGATMLASYSQFLQQQAYEQSAANTIRYVMVATGSAVATLIGGGLGWGNQSVYDANIANGLSVSQVVIPGLLVGDIVKVSAVYNDDTNAAIGSPYVRLEYAENNPSSVGFTSAFANSQVVITAGGGTWIVPLLGMRTVATAGPFQVFFNGYVGTPSGPNYADHAIVSGGLIYEVWRPVL